MAATNLVLTGQPGRDARWLVPRASLPVLILSYGLKTGFNSTTGIGQTMSVCGPTCTVRTWVQMESVLIMWAGVFALPQLPSGNLSFIRILVKCSEVKPHAFTTDMAFVLGNDLDAPRIYRRAKHGLFTDAGQRISSGNPLMTTGGVSYAQGPLIPVILKPINVFGSAVAAGYTGDATLQPYDPQTDPSMVVTTYEGTAVHATGGPDGTRPSA